MIEPQYHIKPFSDKLVRSEFDCGSEALNKYFQQQVTQDIRRRVATCFVAVGNDVDIAGYYTLAAASILLKDLPSEIIKKLPRYPTVPAIRIGRLAIDMRHQGHGLGGALLADALTRILNTDVGAFCIMVDAKDQTASNFYIHHGFISLPDNALVLFMPLAMVEKASRKY